MKVSVNGVDYEVKDDVFNVTYTGDHFEEWQIRFPSKRTTEFFIFEDENPRQAKERMLQMLIEVYMLEENEQLTQDAIQLKEDLKELFGVSNQKRASCFCCNSPMRTVGFIDGGVSFHTHGNYGSEVFDPMNGTYLEIYVCDDCLLDKKEKIHGTGVIEE